MPDKQHPNSPPDGYNPDEDVPFRLPKSDDYQTGDYPEIHLDRPLTTEELWAQDPPLKEDTKSGSDPDSITAQWEEIDADNAAAHYGRPAAPTENMQDAVDDNETGDIPAVSDTDLRAQDPPLRSRRDKDYDPDEDVPFKLPKAENLPADKADKIGNRFVTMPNQGHNSEKTLSGSGGLDPNPDFVRPGTRQQAEPTMKHPVVQAPPSQQAAGDVRYQRPAPTQAQGQAAPRYAPPAPGMSNQPLSQPRPLPRREKQRRFNPGCLAIFIATVVTFCGGFTLLSLVLGGIAYARVGDLVNERLEKFSSYQNFQTTYMYDRNGAQLYELIGEGRRTNVDLSEIPRDLINATIAIEDDEFYSNVGIDVGATTVALLQYVGAGSDGQSAGGSTITQQLVRNVLFPPEYRAERSATRKAEEILLAVALTSRESKDRILEMYLNEIYYGNLAYGSAAAAETLFGKNVTDLSLGEAALLAGLPQAPANLDPLNPDPEVQDAVAERWRAVLTEMVEEGFITPQQRDGALAQGLSFSTPTIDLKAPHFTVYARNQLETLMTQLGYSPEEIALGGLRVYTSLDLDLNDMAQAAVREQISKLTANNAGNGAVVVLKPVTGEILAMVGSKDYYDDNIDGRVNVTTAARQPGSTMKAFTYAAALERGMTAGDVIWDTRTEIGIPGQPAYIPQNYGNIGFSGPTRMRLALANSLNIPAVQTLRWNVGIDYLLQFMARFGVESLVQDPALYGLSLTLGGGEVTPLELTRGYAVFPNNGLLIDTQAIICVLNNDNQILYQYENGCPSGTPTPRTVETYAQGKRVLDERIAFIISDILSDNVARSTAMGSNSVLNTGALISSVKTGTTDNFKDNWTVGFTQNVAVGVWVGNSRGEPMTNVTGLSGAAPIWNQVIRGIYDNQNFLNEFAHNGQLMNDQIQPTQGVSLREVCDFTRLTDPAPGCPATIREWFLDGPAGIPNSDGTLSYPQQALPTPGDGSIELVSPGIYRAIVVPIAGSYSVQFNVTPGQKTPPQPIYCRVPVEQIANSPAAREQWFVAPPPDPNDAVEAENFARGKNPPIAFLPSITCGNDMLQGGGTGGSELPIIIPAYITSPTPGQTIGTEGLAIMGTVQFTPGQAQFYRLLIRGGNFPNWTTIGDIHTNSVTEGQLEFLPGPPGLSPGDYELRLEVIATDSSLLQAPYIVPFRIEG